MKAGDGWPSIGSMHTFDATEVHAKALDSFDPLASRRQAFLFPTVASLRGEVDPHSPPCVYLTGNSLGLQPKSVGGMLQRELEDWHHLGVEGHMHGRDPWLPYHESLRGPLSRIVGARGSPRAFGCRISRSTLACR